MLARSQCLELVDGFAQGRARIHVLQALGAVTAGMRLAYNVQLKQDFRPFGTARILVNGLFPFVLLWGRAIPAAAWVGHLPFARVAIASLYLSRRRGHN